jgi:ribose-phosphate pyrophosphokinase
MRLHDISPIPFFMQYFDRVIPDKTPVVLVSPDKGATQKTLKYAAALEKAGDNIIGVIQCAKVRDPETGKLAGFCKETFRDNNGTRYYGTEDAIIEPAIGAAKPEYVIVDDICDGGGTFIGIRESLFKPEDKVHLWTTHGIYSKGLWPLLKCFSTVGSTDSFLVDGCASGESYHKVRI